MYIFFHSAYSQRIFYYCHNVQDLCSPPLINDLTLPKETLVAVASLLAASSIKDILIGATSSGISYHLRDIY
jgi:hypothetical protein